MSSFTSKLTAARNWSGEASFQFCILVDTEHSALCGVHSVCTVASVTVFTLSPIQSFWNWPTRCRQKWIPGSGFEPIHCTPNSSQPP